MDDPIRLNPAMNDLAAALTESFEALFTQAYPSGLEEEHCEQSRLKMAEKALKDAGIAERKRIREEKAAEAEKSKEEKRDRRQKEIALWQEEALEKARLKAAAKAIKDAEKAVKDAGIAERKRIREEKKIKPPSVQG
ncbi:uncharacterized protein MELLADRAFT_113550 [Melampsora larici-populina 98AG31]|uniref:Uncharacterized protein n=1 Tax=Melampsora larici-populina (strain 98AG31 / pathotype 3-4-7) TaxID=747676 RepID=F4SA96_MELLP|nr:uncharacterized protein MELLADRAFT_113550 [Melampsora larici-populina 98AG31]EGF98442.1 hypothetical protein MELLADRAFT_113550 [Melampsora larici-populina 98AG31]